MNKNSPIIIFDSGVGSYSVAKEVITLLPNEFIIYLADRKSFPYGTKTHEELKENILSRIKWFEKNYDPKLILIASNTPSIQILDEIKPLIQIKLLGVYPPVEKAAELTKKKTIAILATKGTVESPEIDMFIKSKNLSEEINFIKVNASELVALVESGAFQSDKKKTEETIHKLLDPILELNSNIDVMTLSSTHLPFLKDYLEKIYPNIEFLDPAKDVSKEIEMFLNQNQLLNDNEGKLSIITTIDETRGFTVEGLKEILSNLGLETEVTAANIG